MPQFPDGEERLYIILRRLADPNLRRRQCPGLFPGNDGSMIRAAADFCKEAAQSLPLCDLFVYLVIVSGVISFGGRLARLKTGRLSNRRLTFVNLPKYAPQTNPIERIWWHLHETITRNHRHQSLQELLNEIYTWAETQHTFFTQTASFHKTYRIPA